MQFFLFILLTLSLLKGNCQDDFENQYKLIRSNIQEKFETLNQHTITNSAQLDFKESFFIDYILRKYSGEQNFKRFISNRYFLTPIPSVTFKEQSMKLFLRARDTIEINIHIQNRKLYDLGKIQYDSTDYGTKTPNDFKYIKSINEQKIYGLAFDTTEVSQITYISINVNNRECFVADSLFNDLFFPNLIETNYAMKPIEAFLSPNQKYIYLYVFGGQESSKYFCKIIFDLTKKKSIGRMIADVLELQAYKCNYPKNFIGF